MYVPEAFYVDIHVSCTWSYIVLINEFRGVDIGKIQYGDMGKCDMTHNCFFFFGYAL